MKAGLSTILQTLTPEAATVLTHSIAEAGRRSHGQTTPLHVAATLLAPQTGLLRQACIRSNPNASHPLQCRALELCFSVALERLPSAQGDAAGAEPPVSNALMAALKRAKAHQRRGCPEQQQQPLLAVKVELEQLVISILDDPSVSRVMREARFSSPAVKATIEKSLSPAASGNSSPASSIGLGFRPSPAIPSSSPGSIPNRNLSFLNPKLQQGGPSLTQSGNQKGDEVKRVLEILIRTKKRNPVLVGDSEPKVVVKELLRRIESKEMNEEMGLKNVGVIHLCKDLTSDGGQVQSKISVLGISIEERMAKLGCGGVVINLGDLKWLVEQPMGAGVTQQAVSEAGRVAVEEMAKLLTKFSGRVWLIGTATCETYMRCQVYYSNIESDWDLQAVPLAAKTPVSGLFPRLGAPVNVNGPAQSLSQFKNLMAVPNASFTRSMENSVNTNGPAQSLSQMKNLMTIPNASFTRATESSMTTNVPAQSLSQLKNLMTIPNASLSRQAENSTNINGPAQSLSQLKNLMTIPNATFTRPKENTPSVNGPAQSLSQLKNLMTIPNASFTRPLEDSNSAQALKCCPECTQKYELELSEMTKGINKLPTENKSEAAAPSSLPFWLQNAQAPDNNGLKATPQSKNEDKEQIQKSQELLKKWNDTCLRAHPTFHKGLSSCSLIAPTPLTITGLYNSKLLGCQTNPPKLQVPKLLERTVRPISVLSMPSQPPEPVARSATSLLASPVRTDLVLGRKENPETRAAILDEGIRDLISCISSEPQNMSIEMQANKLLSSLLDADSFKKLLRCLTEKVWWQKEAASAVATTVTQCKLGNGKQRGTSSKSDVWLLFTGPDRAAKRKVASVLSDVVCGFSPVIISFGSKYVHGRTNTSVRGKTVLDRITEAVRRNQFSVIMLEDIDEADLLIRGSIKRAMERGRLTDTHGREISLGSVIFILTTTSGPDNVVNDASTFSPKLTSRSAAQGACQLRLTVNERRRKRRANWLTDDDRPWKPRKNLNSALSLDLNETADIEERADSSDHTIDNENDQYRLNSLQLQTLHPSIKEMLNFMDNAVVFHPVNYSLIHQRVSSSIKTSFSSIIVSGLSIEIEEQAVEKISEGIREGHTGLEEWLENVLVPSFQQLKARMKSVIDSETDELIVVQLESDDYSNPNDLSLGDCLPDKIKVIVDGQSV